MKTVYDVQKLKTNEDCFIGNPLKNLLNEIGPEIKMVFVDTFDQRVGHSLLIFKFVNRQEQGNYNLAGKRSLSILVYLKENFEWYKTDEERIKWTKEDAERLGNLTILRIGIVGESL